MDSVRIIVSLPKPLKARLDAKRQEGYTASGYIRWVLEQALSGKEGQNGRQTT